MNAAKQTYHFKGLGWMPPCGNIIPSGASEARHVLCLEIKSNLTVLDLNTSVSSWIIVYLVLWTKKITLAELKTTGFRVETVVSHTLKKRWIMQCVRNPANWVLAVRTMEYNRNAKGKRTQAYEKNTKTPKIILSMAISGTNIPPKYGLK